MAPRCGRAWPLLVVAVALAALGAATGAALALAYRPVGLAYVDVLTRCPPKPTGQAACLAEATRSVGALMLSGAAIALGGGLAGTLLTAVRGERRMTRLRPPHPMVQARFVELCRQHRLIGAAQPRLRIGGRRADSTAGPGRRAAVVLAASAVRQPLVPAVFDPLVRGQLERILSGQAGRSAALRGWPWLLAPVSVALVGTAAVTGTTLGVPVESAVRVMLLAAAVAGLTVGLRGLGGTSGTRTVTWCAVPATGVIAGAGGHAGASVVWHLVPAAGDRLVAGAALAPALLVLAGLLPAITARRPATAGSRRGAAVLAALAGVVAGLVAFPVGTAAAPDLAAPLLVHPSPGGPGAPSTGPHDATGSAGQPDDASGPAPSAAAPGDPVAAGPVGLDTTAANRAARAVESALDPRWRADPLPTRPAVRSRPAGCHPSIVDDYLRRITAGRTGHGVARYAARATAGTGGLGRTTLQVDVVSYRPDTVSTARPVEMVFAAVERAGAACREFADGRSGLRVQSLPRAAPAIGDRAWRMDLVRTLGRGAGRVTATTALGVVQVDTTLVVVSMTASLTAVDTVLFEQAMRRTVAALVADR